MTALEIFTHGDTLVISSETVAEGSGVQHKNVLDMIDANLADFEDFGGVAFETRPFETAGGTQRKRIALLNEQQATLLMTFQRNTDQVRTFKKALVRAFFDKARQATPALPQSYADALRELAASVEQAHVLESKITADAPKVEYVDTFVADGDLRLLRAVAKDLGLSEVALREDLIARKWIYVERATRWSEREQAKKVVCRYSPYADRAAYFQTTPVHDAPRFKGEVMHTLKVTPRGASAIARLKKQAGVFGAVSSVDAAEIAKAPTIIRAALANAVTKDHLDTVAAVGDVRKLWRFLSGSDMEIVASGFAGADAVIDATYAAGTFGAAFADSAVA